MSGELPERGGGEFRLPRPAARQTPTDRVLEPRSWWNRTTDEVSAWFGDQDAMRRRQRDEAAGDHSGEGPASYVDSDARIVDEVNRRLTDDAQVNASKIEVAATAGAVTLSGSVTTSADKSRAEGLAASAPGVSQVQNRLMVA
jgi:osmotically-inducible protein OsmY